MRTAAIIRRSIAVTVSGLVVALATALPASALPDEGTELVPITAPTLGGARTVGSTLTVDTGEWEVPGVTFEFAWMIGDGCCSGGDLPDTGATHVITASDSYMGFIAVTVTASAPGYLSHTTYLSSGRIIADVPPAPFANGNDLTASNAGRLTVTTSGDEATILIPDTGPGIQFYVYGYSLPTPLGFHITDDPHEGEWQPAYPITVDYSSLAAGPQKLAVLTTSGRLVGWVWVDADPLDPPVADGSGLDTTNDGGAASTETGNVADVEVPGGEPGAAVFVVAYSTPTVLGWYIVDADGRIQVDYSSLPLGEHKLAIMDQEGNLLGWVAVTKVALATTGAEAPVGGILAALVLLGLGGALVVARRRRPVVD